MKDEDLKEALKSIHDAIAFSSRDWSLNHRDAWIYGIACGWDEFDVDAAKQHKWDDQTLSRLRRLRAAVEKATKSDQEQQQ